MSPIVPDSLRRIAQTLDRQRKRAGLTKRGLAEIAGVSEDKVYRLLSPNPRGRLDTLAAVSVALDCNMTLVPRRR